jgi:hypothetical protein
MSEVSVLLIVFNRPDKVAASLEQLSRFFSGKLYISCDGPRAGGCDEEKIDEVWKIVDRYKDKFTIYTQRCGKNIGCRLGVISAIDWFFESEDEGIILEDDIFVTPQFLEFCKRNLEHFRDDSRIGSISGCNPGAHLIEDSNSYYFSVFNFIWGWATWKRSWSLYRKDMEYCDEWISSGGLKSIFWGSTFIESYWEKVFSAVKDGRVDTWDAQWAYTCWSNNLLCVMPRKNLVTNFGFDDDATHTMGQAPDFLSYIVSESEALEWDRVPAGVCRNNNLDLRISSALYAIPRVNKFFKKAGAFKRRISNAVSKLLS